MSLKSMQEIENEFKRRQELFDLAIDFLAERAHRNRIQGNVLQVAVIILGALIASRNAAEQILGNSTWVQLFYAALGMLTVAAGGLLAAFKYGDKASVLQKLSAESQVIRESMESQWAETLIALESEPEPQRKLAAVAVLKLQDSKMSEMYAKAADLTNITRGILNKEAARTRKKVT